MPRLVVSTYSSRCTYFTFFTTSRRLREGTGGARRSGTVSWKDIVAMNECQISALAIGPATSGHVNPRCGAAGTAGGREGGEIGEGVESG